MTAEVLPGATGHPWSTCEKSFGFFHRSGRGERGGVATPAKAWPIEIEWWGPGAIVSPQLEVPPSCESSYACKSVADHKEPGRLGPRSGNLWPAASLGEEDDAVAGG